MRKKLFLIPLILLLLNACGSKQVNTAENSTKIESSEEKTESQNYDKSESKTTVGNTERIEKDFGTWKIFLCSKRPRA